MRTAKDAELETARTIQGFCERMAGRREQAGDKQAAVAFWIVRNYIEDRFIYQEDEDQ